MRLIAGPEVQLFTGTVLVWSETWKAEGEKRKFDNCLKHTRAVGSVPAQS
jgi:hypothetical protein